MITAGTVIAQDTYVDRLSAALGDGPDRTATVAGTRRIGCARARDTMVRLAAALRESALNTGDEVGVIVGNTPESIVIAAAVQLAGCRLVFLPTKTRPTELVEFVAQAELSALVFEPDFVGKARDVPITVSFSLGPMAGFTDLVALAANAAEDIRHATTDSVRTVFHTGSPTGKPLLVTHGHDYHNGLLWALRAHQLGDLDPPPTLLIPMRLNRTSGHQAAATGAVVRDGWLHSGDLGRLDQNGYLHLVGRVKNMIIVDVDATNVYPHLLDEFLVSLPGIRTAATMGVLDDDRVERIETFIVPEPGFDIVELPELILAEFDASYLPSMIHLIDAMPMTHLGQPDKYALRALASD
jgi:acyl-CoA synthetase (AMP-forming)/AMP-acid ligase II